MRQRPGTRCEQSGGGGGADGTGTEQNSVCRYHCCLICWSPLSCGRVLTGGRNRTGQGTRAAGGGAPGRRPRPFRLGRGGVRGGVGRRGEGCVRYPGESGYGRGYTGQSLPDRSSGFTPPVPTVLPVPCNQDRGDSSHVLSWPGGPPQDPAGRGAGAHG